MSTDNVHDLTDRMRPAYPAAERLDFLALGREISRTDDMPDVGLEIFRPRPVAEPLRDGYGNVLSPRHCACDNCVMGLPHLVGTA